MSHWDGNINWNSVRASGVKFAYIKATGSGSNGLYSDTQFTANVKCAKAAGVAVGAYHYALPSAPYSSSEAVKQADFFVSTMKASMPSFGDIMPVLDFENNGSLSPTDQVNWIRTFIKAVKVETNRNVMLYTSEDFIQTNGDLNNQLSDIPLWIAYWPAINSDTIPPNIAGWTNWTVWQYSDTDVVPGITGQTDIDYGTKSLDSLGGYLTKTTATSAANTATTTTITKTTNSTVIPVSKIISPTTKKPVLKYKKVTH
ncbi:MAG: glycoside hydrolase family 25 protein [Bacillota bacterium]|nr:glycoside hydrolase family 25 protein [Bacillota bacterium]